MVEGRAVPPDRGHVGGVAAEQQRGSPPTPGRARRDARASPRPAASRRASRASAALMPPPRAGSSIAGERRELRVPAIAPSPSAGAPPRRSPRPAPDRPSRASDRVGLRAGRRRRRCRSRPGSASMPVEGAGEATTGRRHRHRLQHLVLDAARDARAARPPPSAAASQGRTSATSPVTITPGRRPSARPRASARGRRSRSGRRAGRRISGRTVVGEGDHGSTLGR